MRIVVCYILKNAVSIVIIIARALPKHVPHFQSIWEDSLSLVFLLYTKVIRQIDNNTKAQSHASTPPH